MTRTFNIAVIGLILSVCFSWTGAAYSAQEVRVLLVDDDDGQPDVESWYEIGLSFPGLGAPYSFPYDIWTTAADGEPETTTLSAYDIVLWVSGQASAADGPGKSGKAGPSETGEAALGAYLDEGGCVFISSQDYYAAQGQVTSFMREYLGVQAVNNDAFGDGEDLYYGGGGTYNPDPFAFATGENLFGSVPDLPLFGYELAGEYFNRGDDITPIEDSQTSASFTGNLYTGARQEVLLSEKSGKVVGIARDAGTYLSAYFAFVLDGPFSRFSNSIMNSLAGRCVDLDEDGVTNALDNCRISSNADQTNSDDDELGDACDPDDDNDGFTDEEEIAAGSSTTDATSTPDTVRKARGLPSGVLNLLLED